MPQSSTILLFVLTGFVNTLPLPPVLDPTSDTKLYGTEPYQLQFQEPPPNHRYYPTQIQTTSNYGTHPRQHQYVQPERQHQYLQPERQHQYHQPERQRLVTQPQADYDPFYFSRDRGTTRNRRNSKFRDFEFVNNDLPLNEDIHFFRRKSKPHSRFESESGESIRFHKDSDHRLPVHDSRPYFPSSSSRTGSYPPLGNTVDHHSQYPMGSNYIEYYDVARHHGNIPILFGPERHRYPREPIEGWSVQIGTQLKVHDDGRERNPSQFYVQDEKPASTRRYPQRMYEYLRT